MLLFAHYTHKILLCILRIEILLHLTLTWWNRAPFVLPGTDWRSVQKSKCWTVMKIQLFHSGIAMNGLGLVGNCVASQAACGYFESLVKKSHLHNRNWMGCGYPFLLSGWPQLLALLMVDVIIKNLNCSSFTSWTLELVCIATNPLALSPKILIITEYLNTVLGWHY